MLPQDAPLFLTMVNRAYWPGLLAFAYSLSVNAGPVVKQLTVLQEDPIPIQLRSKIASFGLQCVYINRQNLRDLHSTVKQAQPRLQYAFKKLAMLKFPHEGRVCFMDVDMLCLNALNGVESMRHLSAAPDRGIREPKNINGYPMFNTGFVVYTPSKELYDAVYEYAMTTDRPIHKLADQSVLNWYFYENDPSVIHLLDHDWNTLKRVHHHMPDHFDLNHIKLLHYVGPKPWEGPAHDDGQQSYLQLRQLWWSYFKKAGGPELFPEVPAPPDA